MATRCDSACVRRGWTDANGGRCRPAASHAALARSVTMRLMLNAALAKTKSVSTFGQAAQLHLPQAGIVLSHPKARSMRGRAC